MNTRMDPPGVWPAKTDDCERFWTWLTRLQRSSTKSMEFEVLIGGLEVFRAGSLLLT
jgi:hypothetical protein